MTYKTFNRSLAAVLFLGLSCGAQAAGTQGVAARMAAGVGQWIAAQGNAALREIGEDLKQDLADQLEPLLPQSPAQQQPADTQRLPGQADTLPPAQAPSV